MKDKRWSRDRTPDPEDLGLVFPNEELKLAVVKIVELHIPSYAEPLLSPIGVPYPGVNRSSAAASVLLLADLTATEKFGASRDRELLKEMDFLARCLFEGYLQLSKVTRARLLAKMEVARRDEKTFIDKGLGELMEAIYNLSHEPTFRTRPSRKRNWRAASLADECRRVWAMGHWNEAYPSGRTTPEDRERYQAHLRDFAPRWEKHDLPGPFGRFLTDVLDVFDVKGASGQAVSAATALASWRAAMADAADSR